MIFGISLSALTQSAMLDAINKVNNDADQEPSNELDPSKALEKRHLC